jgi:histidinol-phosphate aminotransferase
MERIIIMDRNENNYGPSPKCTEIVKNVTIEHFSTYSRDYPRKIKTRIADQYSFDPDAVAIGYGAEDLLKQVIYWTAEPGAVIAVPDMSWWYYKHIVNETKVSMLEYHLVEKEDTWDFDDEEIIAILKRKPTAFILASPNNPTGNYLEPSRIQRYLKEKDPSTLFVLDEAYWGFGAPSFPIEDIPRYDRFIVLRTMSKYYALAGMRIGFAFMGKGMDAFVTYNSKYLGFNRLSEELLYAALDGDSASYYQEKAKMMIEDGKLFFEHFKELGFKPYRTCANFVLARLPEDIFLYLKENLVLHGFVIKFFSEPIFKNCIRISIGTHEQNVLLIEVIEALVKKVRK